MTSQCQETQFTTQLYLLLSKRYTVARRYHVAVLLTYTATFLTKPADFPSLSDDFWFLLRSNQRPTQWRFLELLQNFTAIVAQLFQCCREPCTAPTWPKLLTALTAASQRSASRQHFSHEESEEDLFHLCGFGLKSVNSINLERWTMINWIKI